MLYNLILYNLRVCLQTLNIVWVIVQCFVHIYTVNCVLLKFNLAYETKKVSYMDKYFVLLKCPPCCNKGSCRLFKFNDPKWRELSCRLLIL